MKEQNQRVPKPQQCRIQRAVTLVEANFATKLSRKEMARAACLSVSHFSRLFTQSMGLSPHQYLLRCRLLHAKKPLLTPERGLSIVDVAADAGFADQAHFSRHFRRAYGVSPLAFRRNASRESEAPTNPGNLKTGCYTTFFEAPSSPGNGAWYVKRLAPFFDV